MCFSDYQREMMLIGLLLKNYNQHISLTEYCIYFDTMKFTLRRLVSHEC